MAGLYNVIRILHNAFGGLTLLLTLVAALLLLITARTTSQGSALALRGNSISASIQAVLGILMVILGVVIGNAAYIGNLWLHYLLGIVSVGVISAFAARARRSPDSDARRFGGILLGVLVLVAITFYLGQMKINPFA